MIACRQHHDGEFLVYQRVRTVLEFSRGISFGMSIGNLFELECAFASDGVMHAASEIEELLGLEMHVAEVFGEASQVARFFSIASGNRINRCK